GRLGGGRGRGGRDVHPRVLAEDELVVGGPIRPASATRNHRLRYARVKSVIRQARREDLPAIRRLMEEPGFWQRDWSDRALAKGIETAGESALVWEDDSTIAV